MTTLTLTTPGHFTFHDTPAPTEVPPGHALVRVHRVGVCGTDWHAFAGKQPFFTYPRILGHELGVEVLSVNDPNSALKPGDRCSVEPYLRCGKCIACRRGKTNCCISLQCLGVHTDGGMREQIVIPTRQLHPSSKLTLDQLALVETLAIGCHAVERSEVQKGENVLIIGAGPIGLSVIPFVLAKGANAVVTDISSFRLDFTKQAMRATHTLLSTPNLASDLQSLLGDLPTLIIDATGNPASMASTFNLAAQGGAITFVGLFQGDLTFNDPNFHRREITLRGSRNALPHDFTNIISLIESGQIDTTPWITHRSPAHDFPSHIPSWQKPDSKLLKAVIEF